MNIFDFLRSKICGEPSLNPLERTQAKRWVKERLKTIYPELRARPRALEEAYHQLSLEPREGAGEDGTMAFEVILPESLGLPSRQ